MDKKYPNSFGKYSSSGYIYVIQFNEYYKIGRSIKPEQRIQEIKVNLPLKPKVIVILKAYNMTQLENQLHVMFRTRRTQGEWFLLSDSDIEYIQETFRNKRNFTKERKINASLGHR